MSQSAPLSSKFSGGCYIGFNAAIDRKAAEQLVTSLMQAKANGFGEINLCLSSVGGILGHTYYAINIIETINIPIVTWNIGNIQSAANMLYLCGVRRLAVPGSTFFSHQSSYDLPATRINEPYLEEKLKAVRYEDQRSAIFVAHKTGRPPEEVRRWQNTELVMDTNAALDCGLIHEVRAFAIPSDALFHQIVI